MSVVAFYSLAENEAIIERNLPGFIEVGNALMRIRDGEQYREAGFNGFVEYLDSKPWGIGQAEAYRQIQAAQVVETLGLPDPVNVAQAEALAPLMRKGTPQVVKQVYAEVVEETTGHPTARAIREKVREVIANGNPPPARRHGRPDFNKRIDEGVIPKARELTAQRAEPDDWRIYSQTTLRRHIRVLRTTQERLAELISQAESCLGHRPTK